MPHTVTMLSSVTVRAPATTANLGPGFDCLGMALDIWNVVNVRPGPASFEVRGEGKGELTTGPGNLVYKSFRMAFAEAGRPAPEVSIVCDNGVPVARGLGSSSAAVVTGLTAANELMGRAISHERLLQMASELEGHPDNVAAALLGGCRVVVRDDGRLVTGAVAVPDGLKAVLFIPDMPMATAEARAVLPGRISAEDAIYNIGRVGLLVGALSSGDLSLLGTATQDRMHQPYRGKIFPAMKNIFRSAMDAGALGVFLSGAGSAVLALTRGREVTIGYEMADAAAKSGIEGAVRVTQPSPRGVEVLDRE